MAGSLSEERRSHGTVEPGDCARVGVNASLDADHGCDDRPMRALIPVVLLAGLLAGACSPHGAPGGADEARAPRGAPVPEPPRDVVRPASRDDGDRPDALFAAIRAHARNAPVEGRGTVRRVLRDDREGSAHQKFLLGLDDGTTVLVAHNIDLAPRLDGLAEGDTLEFHGEYVWTPKGGTVHWTHRDPDGRHAPGWLRWRGRTYD